MRKSIVGLLSLAVASTVGVSLTAPATGAPAGGGAPDDGTRTSAAPAVDDLPNPMEEKRRDLRAEAIAQVVNGEATPVDRGVSTVLKVGETPAVAETRAPGRQARPQRDQYVELAREKTDQIFVILAEFGNERHPDYPGPGHRPRHARSGARSTGRCTTRSPSRTARSTTRPSGRRTTTSEYFQQLYFGTGRGDESLKTYYETAVLRPLQRRRHGHRLGQGPLQRGPLRPQQRLPVRRHRLRQHVGPDPGRGQPVGRRPEGRRDDRRADQRRAGDVRPVGPLRLRRRRQLQRARRLHRPLPDRARRRGRGRRRPAPGRGRDLEPPLVRVRHRRSAQPARRTTSSAAPRSATPASGSATTPSSRRTAASASSPTSTATTSACPTTTTPPAAARTPIELLDADGAEPARRRNDDGIGDPRRRHRRLGQAAARLARLRDRRGRPEAHAQARAAGVQHQAKPQALVVVLPKKAVTTELGRAVRRAQRSGGAATVTTSQHADPSGRPDRQVTGDADVQGRVRHRGPTTTTSTSRCRPTAAPTGRPSTARSTEPPIPGDGIDGNPALAGTPATFDLSAYAGRLCGLRFRYLPRFRYGTDGGVAPNGFFADAITGHRRRRRRSSPTAPRARRERLDADGFSRRRRHRSPTTTTTTTSPSNRSYVSYDRYLKTGPYNFGFPNTRPDWVEHFPYQNGLLIWYWDTSQADNNTSEHPGRA